ncbi:MAG: zinc finger CCCH domain-containing protein, partial [Pseudomonadota bacterium]|nr:zinc finger CCCH domain-containing protein [Pseudomonadota bacterium]
LMARTQETINFQDRKKGFKALTGQGGTQNALATETAGSGKDKGKGKGKGKGRGSGGDAGGGTGSTAADPMAATAKDGRRFCFFNIKGNCTRGAECQFSHDTPPKAIAEAIKNHTGPLGRSRSPSPNGRRRSRSPGLQRQQNGETAAPALQTATAAPAATGRGRTVQEKFGGLKQLWCPFNLKGNCKKGDNCPLPHIPAESKNAIQKSIARAMEIQKAAADSAAAASSQ